MRLTAFLSHQGACFSELEIMGVGGKGNKALGRRQPVLLLVFTRMKVPPAHQKRGSSFDIVHHILKFSVSKPLTRFLARFCLQGGRYTGWLFSIAKSTMDNVHRTPLLDLQE